ncbi:uncharacterized protein LOC126267014 [Schistocerca gregaria]|uniref:uncharacterized protein LOC126267014 n=1 Tax=Schistocerca gregaria TaxID=7010 RepID=UPI00211E96E1|nr:uncharacterized protein LOC126267014 [Schistocerca gregaria]
MKMKAGSWIAAGVLLLVCHTTAAPLQGQGYGQRQGEGHGQGQSGGQGQRAGSGAYPSSEPAAAHSRSWSTPKEEPIAPDLALARDIMTRIISLHTKEALSVVFRFYDMLRNFARGIAGVYHSR